MSAVNLQYFGHSFFKLKSKDGVVLIDPIFDNTKTNFERVGKLSTKRKDFEKVGLILLTNEMLEHFDKEAVEEIASKNNASVIAHESILTDLNISRNLKIPIKHSNEIFLKGFKIKPVIAHCPQSFCPTGFIIENNGKRIYHAGVTSLLDTFSDIKVDVAILPLSNKSMDVVDLVRAAKIIKPKTLIPMQYDIFEKISLDPLDLKKRISESVLETQTILLKPNKKLNI